jgi:regulation of enolase protein 1 (concanavalin A-like superfamily)
MRPVPSMRLFLFGLFVLLSLIPSQPLIAQAPDGISLVVSERTDGAAILGTAVDSAGNIWTAGYTYSATLPTTSGALQSSTAGQADGVLTHMRPDGTVLYRTYLGGSGIDFIYGITLDAAGNIYLTGRTLSPDFPTSAGAYDPLCGSTGRCDDASTHATEGDAFVTKLTPDGKSILYSTFLGGGADDEAVAIAVDGSGRAYVVGSTHSNDMPRTSNAVRSTRTGIYEDAFYVRLSADGSTLEYGTYLGGSEADDAYGVALDGSGDVYIAGITSSSDFTLVNAMKSVFPSTSTSQAFVAEFNGAGVVFSTLLGGSGNDNAKGIAVSPNGVYISGGACSLDFPGAPARASNGQTCPSAAYVARMALDGSVIVRTTLLDGSGFDFANAVSVDSTDTVWMGGTTTSPDFPVTSDAAQKSVADTQDDAFIARIPMADAATGAATYSSYLGGSDLDYTYALALDADRGAFLSGFTQSADFPTVNGTQPSGQTEGTAFIAHFADSSTTRHDVNGEVVLYARDASAVQGNWQLVSDPTAAAGERIWNPDAGVPKIATPSAAPANYFELTFQAQAGLAYHLWLRMKADNDSWQNDSVYAQFSDSTDSAGNPVWRIGTTSGTTVSLEDCTDCGEHGWGWNDNGYGVPGQLVMFSSSGPHTIRIQQREDGVSIDQVVLSSGTYASVPPGTPKDDAHVLTQSSGAATTNAPPTVTITRPFQGDEYPAPAQVTLTGTASDSDGSIAKVEIYVNGELQETTNQASFSGQWDLSAGTYTFVAVATDNQGASTSSSPVTIRVGTDTSGFPSGWTDADVGDTGAQGSGTFYNGTFTVKGAGADVWGTADAFNYAYTTLVGDGMIQARVASVSGEASWVKAGVMIRDSQPPSSEHAFMLVSYAKGVAFQRRTETGGSSVSTSGSASTAPHWVRLVRTGNTILSYESTDGSNWTFVRSDTFTMSNNVLIGLAVSSHVRGTLATATFDNVKVQQLPSGWGDADIGNVPFAGFATEHDGTFDVTGSGADIWGTADAFHYAWHLMNGDGTITARVVNVDDVSQWVKGGVMIRDSFDPGSPQAFVLVSHSKGVAFQRREVAGGESVSTAGSASTSPHWVKLTRSGDTFTAYESADGSNWTDIGADTIHMAQAIYIGLAVTSHDTTSSATCTFDNVMIQ